jgi:hypothetical protein
VPGIVWTCSIYGRKTNERRNKNWPATFFLIFFPFAWLQKSSPKFFYAYYGITGNIISLQEYLREVTRIWKKWLNRRSWRGDKLNWDKFRVLLKEHIPLPPGILMFSGIGSLVTYHFF